MDSVSRAVLPLAAAVLACATGYEVAAAVGAIDFGPVPGEGTRGDGAVLAAALAALVVAAVLLWVARGPRAAAAAVLLAGATFVVARFYTFDPYYAPSLRRMSEDGLVAGRWIVVLVAAAALAAAVAAAKPRVGMRAGAVVLVLCALTALGEGAGH